MWNSYRKQKQSNFKYVIVFFSFWMDYESELLLEQYFLNKNWLFLIVY